MAPITIPVIVTPAYLPGDAIELEIDGTLQPERYPVAAAGRERQGFGYGSASQTLFGALVLPGRDVAFGAGLFGLGGFVLDLTTRSSFGPGDYGVRIRSRDEAGNASAWSSRFTVRHRPQPAAPSGLAIDASGVLSWDAR